MFSRTKPLINTLFLIIVAFLFSFFGKWFMLKEAGLLAGNALIYTILAVIFLISYGVNLYAKKTPLPAFVWCIIFGIALQPLLAQVGKETGFLTIITELIAALILFGGGVELSFQNFRKWVLPIACLAVVGSIATGILFSYSLFWLKDILNINIPVGIIVLVGALLVSTDPAAIIPSLEHLKFKKPFLKDFAISESALNDVVGTILTRIFLVSVISSQAVMSVSSYYQKLFSQETLLEFSKEVIIGILCGVAGAYILKFWSKRKEKIGLNVHKAAKNFDVALFLGLPIAVFALGGLLGGAGMLSVFLTGLIYEYKSHAKPVKEFFETFIDGFGKPIIFILLGAIAPLAILTKSFFIGLIIALVFMLIIRPLIVFVSLSPWYFQKIFTWRELAFLSFVRETGVIPAVLIVILSQKGIPGAEFLFAIGMWVILLTLIIEPPLTPLVAKKLKVAK